MFALVESGNITQTPKGNKGIQIGDIKYPAAIYTLWTSQDKTDCKIPSDKDVGDVAVEGLKTIKKRIIDNQCAGILAPSDWRVTKEQETGDAMDSGWKTWRGNVRTKCNSMQTAIDNASDVAALETLFTYTTDSDGDTTRPLGEFPVKE